MHELDDKESRIGNTGKLSHHSSDGMLFAKIDLVTSSTAPRRLLHEHYHPLHGLQGLFVLPTSELGKEETQIGKVKEERKTPPFKVLSYLVNTAHASLLLTPDRCGINLRKREL